MNRRQLAIALSALPLASMPIHALASISGALKASVAGPQRTAKNRVRDAFRHPAETLSFWGLRPRQTVIEIDPAGGYWTEILAPYLKANHGHYVAAQAGDGAAFKALYGDPAVWGETTLAKFEATSGPLVPDGTADMVIASRNIHDWMWTPGRLDKALADFHAALKHGGVLAVEEHRADPRPIVNEARDGYVATACVPEAGGSSMSTSIGSFVLIPCGITARTTTIEQLGLSSHFSGCSITRRISAKSRVR